jgi:hypothetical protein
VRIPSISLPLLKIYAIIRSSLDMEDITTPVELIYDGEAVKDGSVPAEYLVDALVGFSSAYSKIARRTEGAGVTHRIRVVGLRPNSTHILVDIIEWVKVNPAAAGVLVSAVSLGASGAYKIIKDMGRVFTAKKHLKGEPVENRYIFKNNNIYIFNETKQELHLTKEQFEYLRSGLIDPDLDKLTAPLEDDKVEKFQLKSKNESLAEANKNERPYFATTHKQVATTRDDVTLEGSLNSLTKDKRRGTFYTVGGKHIPYQFVGQNEQALLNAFTHPGVVRAKGKVGFDGDLEPTKIEISDIVLEQPDMFSKDTASGN